MNQVVSEWPIFYPPNTPPAEAVTTTGTAFRLVTNNPPLRDDFCSTYEESPERRFKDDRGHSLACGTSHFSELKDIQKKRNLFPKLRSKKIAEGLLNSSFGVMLSTFEPSHFTVWYKRTSSPQGVFKVLESV